MKERLFRGDGFEHERSRREDFDPIAEGKRYGLAPDVSAAIWEHVRREATNRDGQCDENLARERFAQVAKRIAERGGQLGPALFKWTQVDVASGTAPVGNVLADPVPSRTTLVLARASGRARVGLNRDPGRTTLVASQADSDVCTPEDSRGFFRRCVSGGHAARSKLERAIASHDHYAALVATIALKQDLKWARHHLDNELEHDEGLRAELAALERPAEHLLAKVPNMSRAVGNPAAASNDSRELWGLESAEWRAAIGSPTWTPEPAATQLAAALQSPRAEQMPPAFDHAAGRDELPGASDVARAIAALKAPPSSNPAASPKPPTQEPTEAAHAHAAAVAHRAEPRDPVRLPAPLRDRMERALGQRFDDIDLHPDSAEVPAGQRAFTRERHIYLEPGAVDLESPRGEHIIAHELAHVVQQRGGGERDGTRQELESEAARAAALSMRGQTARIALRAQPTMAYAFSEGAEHEDELDAATGDTTDAANKDTTKPDATQAPNAQHAGVDVDADAQHDHAANPSAGESKAPHGDPGGDMEAVAAIVPAEETPVGAPGVGGSGSAAKAQKEPPSVATAKPELGLGQLRGVRPDKLGPVLGEVHTAASTDIARTRAEQRANPPKHMSTGAGTALDAKVATPQGTTPKGAAPKNATLKDTAPKEAPPATAGAKDAADRPVKGEVPGGEAAKQATQGAVVEQKKTASELITSVAHSIASWFSLWGGALFGRDDDARGAKMSDEESRQMAGSVDKLPTTAAGVSTDAGPAPELAMKGEAKASADRDRAAFEARAAAFESQGRTDSRAPMGEDHIETTAPPEELTAMSLVAGMPAATPAAALPTLASAPSEEVGIVAQEQHGAEVDVALAKASTDVTAKRARHTEQDAQVRAESDAQFRELKTKADADQAAARDAAQAEVQTARGEWQAEVDKKGADARKQAGQKVAEGMAQVEAEETKANAEAEQHIEDGRRKADEEKQKGEKAAADTKQNAKHKSSGFWGWVSSKANAAFDGVKKAVSSAIDACRRAVKAVIEGAKKLAMAAIELARKAINAAIKAIGHALIAISDVLLAAFPELKAKFQGAIRKTVDKAIAALNKLADRLKQAVQKALDQLVAALDQALQLLEKGINAIIDVANAVVQGAIKAAQAVVEMLGTWAKLIKDIVSAPGAWLGKLGSAIIDGIKNHLWSAFKTTVLEWLKSKVFELLGIGGVILQLLLDGGLTKEHILEMALDALIVAIPAALVAILIEKLVAMIVPAAGALMAIIEGLQAAWGTISRIIAAFGAFMAFLLAIKSGGAGPLFAAVLAGAAVVVLDFVANWLLKKLASAARKVGARLKGLAEKFKRKGNENAKPKKHHDAHDEKVPHKKTDKDESKDRDQNKNEKKEADKQKRLAEAVRAIRPKLAALIAKQPSKLGVRGQLVVWKLRHRLTELRMEGRGKRVEFIAKVNPEENVGNAEDVPLGEDLKKAESPRTGFYYRGDDEWRPGDSIGVPLTDDTLLPDAQELIDHVHPKAKDEKKRTARGRNEDTGPTKMFVSFAEIIGNKAGGAAKFTRMNRISKVAREALDRLVAEGTLRILTPDDVAAIIAVPTNKKSIRNEANNVKATMLRNHEVLVQGFVPGGLLGPVK